MTDTDPEPDRTLDQDEATADVGDLEYADVHAFVTDWFTATISRPLGGTHRWCASWWDHPEAFLRLDALWRAYEYLQGDPSLGPITFLTNHLDPTLAVLLGPTGPFARCTPDRHEHHQPLPHNPAPNGAPGKGDLPSPAVDPLDLPAAVPAAPSDRAACNPRVQPPPHRRRT